MHLGTLLYEFFFYDMDVQTLCMLCCLCFQACSMRKVNEMVKRIRLAVVHICVLGTLRSKMPYLWGKETTQAKLIENLQQVGFPYRYKYVHTYSLEM